MRDTWKDISGTVSNGWDDAHNVKGIVRSSALVVGGAEHLLPTVPEMDWSDAFFDVDAVAVFPPTLGSFFVFLSRHEWQRQAAVFHFACLETKV